MPFITEAIYIDKDGIDVNYRLFKQCSIQYKAIETGLINVYESPSKASTWHRWQWYGYSTRLMYGGRISLIIDLW